MSGTTFKPFLFGLAVGAAAEFMLDPRAGRRRRALTRDKLTHSRRVLRRRVLGWERGMEGPLRGAAHRMSERLCVCGPGAEEQDAVLKDRVESELGHVPGLPLSDLNFDAADGVVHVRGTVADEYTAARVVEAAARVEGVREVVSLMRLADSTPVGGVAGEDIFRGRMRTEIFAGAIRTGLLEAFPGLTDDDVIASGGHIGRLVQIIVQRTGAGEQDVRRQVDAIVLAAV
jgi:hypothetical protein